MNKITADRISDFFIEKSIEFDTPNGENITNMKVQKLITYAYSWYLGLRGKRLFEERIEAWDFGCVVHSQFQRFAPFANMPIIRENLKNNDIAILPNEIRNFLTHIWNCYGIFSASELSKMHHREMPWRKSYKEGEKRLLIDDELIKNFYSYDNEKIANYLPENVVLTINDDGLYEIVRFMAFDDIDCE